MSKKYPECPMYNHSHCKDYDNPKLCAIVREDKVCVKKNPQSELKKQKKRLYHEINGACAEKRFS